MIAGSKANREMEELFEKELIRLSEADPRKFLEDWVLFDLHGDEAAENIRDLLWDYCHLHGHCTLSNSDSFRERLLADLRGIGWTMPEGWAFRLDYQLQSPRRTWFWQSRKHYPVLSVIIEAEKVIHVQGSLTEFVVRTKTFHLRCGERVEII